MNCKQDHSANDIIHIFIKYIYIYKINLKKKKKHAMNNTNISNKRKEKINARMKLNTYLHEYTLQWKNTLEIKEIFTSLTSKIFYLQKRSS